MNSMTNVEVLLSVEKGEIPAGVEVFYEQSQEAPRYGAWMMFAVVMAVATIVTVLRAGDPETSRWEVALMGLVAAFAALMAVPVRDDEKNQREHRPRLLVMSERGIITRDSWGLQNWDYEELVRISTAWVGGRPHLVIEERGGKEHLLDFALFQDSTRIVTTLKKRVGG